MSLWVLYALLSAAFFSAKDIIAKKLFVNKEIEHENILFHEYVFYLFVLIFFIPFIDFISFTDYWYLYLFKATTVGLSSFLYFKLLKEHNITMVAPLLNLSPIILLLLSAPILGERITTLHTIGIFIMVAATYYLEVILQHHKKEKPHKHHWYTFKRKNIVFFLTTLALLIIISFAAISDRLVLEQVNVPTNLFFTAFIVTIALLIVYKPKTMIESITQFKTHPKTLLFSILFVISTALVLLAINLPDTQVSLIIPLRRSATLFSAIFGGLLFHENNLIKKIIAVIIMITGIFLLI